MSFGGIEAGGTRWTCAVAGGDGSSSEPGRELPDDDPGGDDRPRESSSSPPSPTSRRSASALFGPVEVRPRRRPRWGTITTTPKPGWAATSTWSGRWPRRSACRSPSTPTSTRRPIGEWRHGAARGLDTFVLRHRRHRDRRRRLRQRARRSTACCTRRSATCWSPTTAPATPSGAAAPSTATASRGWRRGRRCAARWGRPGEELDRPRGLGAGGGVPRATAWSNVVLTRRPSGSSSAAASAAPRPDRSRPRPPARGPCRLRRRPSTRRRHRRLPRRPTGESAATIAPNLAEPVGPKPTIYGVRLDQHLGAAAEGGDRQADGELGADAEVDGEVQEGA